MDNTELYNRLVKLGDMIGDGLHHEPDGKWIEKEYKKILLQLGIIKRKPKNITKINEFMEERIQKEICTSCGEKLKQTKSGSLRAKCIKCGILYQLGKK